MTLKYGTGEMPAHSAAAAGDALAPAPAATSASSSDYRTGTAARLAGLPVETLRVWERRYGISDTARSARGQRLYSDQQVRRLALIKQLVDKGHAVGVLAKLSEEQLHALLPAPAGGAAEHAGAPPLPVRVALVGDALVRRLAAGGRELFALDIVAACAGLEQAGSLAAAGAEVLLIELAELSNAALAPIAALRAQLGAAAVVLYRFAASGTLARLRADGCIVAQAPADLAQLVLLCESARPAAGGQLADVAAAAVPASAPRFDDTSLAALSAITSAVACECPRHLAELLLMLASFERYSGECANRSPADAALHRDLQQSAGHARLLLEDALERLARAEGLALPVRGA
ncbi:MerR family transcriptional regulator [Massilia sp. PWRC2]|uniref:MerR family transcriptional regulator n=1 Tax=Massilia sp. PWRC2 TaxID=2804626 RepID=UPI003CF73A43